MMARTSGLARAQRPGAGRRPAAQPGGFSVDAAVV